MFRLGLQTARAQTLVRTAAAAAARHSSTATGAASATQSPKSSPQTQGHSQGHNHNHGSKPMTVDVELPDPFAQRTRRRISLGVFAVLVSAAFMSIVNYERVSSPIIGSTMHFLRRSPVVRELVGDNVGFWSIFPWIHGEFNQVKGDIDITFSIVGSKGKTGKVYFRANRPHKQAPLQIYEWSVQVDGVKHDILSDSTPDFL